MHAYCWDRHKAMPIQIRLCIPWVHGINACELVFACLLCLQLIPSLPHCCQFVQMNKGPHERWVLPKSLGTTSLVMSCSPNRPSNIGPRWKSRRKQRLWCWATPERCGTTNQAKNLSLRLGLKAGPSWPHAATVRVPSFPTLYTLFACSYGIQYDRCRC